MKRKVLIAAHGHLASGYKSALDLLAGAPAEVEVIDAYVGDPGEDYRALVAEFSSSIAPDEQAVIFTDLFGGSVNQLVVSVLQSIDSDLRSRIFLVTGTNLMALVGVVLEPRELSNEVLDELLGFATVERVRLDDPLGVFPKKDVEEEDDFFAVA